MSAILTLNAGSSSLKFGLYHLSEEPELLLKGQVENLGPQARLKVKGGDTREIGPADHAVSLHEILQAIEPVLEGRVVLGVGHRVVHGGMSYGEPEVLTEPVLAKLRTLEPLAPLHQPHNLAAVYAAQKEFPESVQIGCFDTAFHRHHPFVNDTYALPYKYYEEGVRRYGFHGISYDYITSCLRRDWPELYKGRVVVAHLGNGASMCAIKGGQSVSSTMGFSALDGLPMGTRCGQLDPGVLLYFMAQGMDAAAISDMLYNDSGLKGLSGISHDMRTLLDSGESPCGAGDRLLRLPDQARTGGAGHGDGRALTAWSSAAASVNMPPRSAPAWWARWNSWGSSLTPRRMMRGKPASAPARSRCW